MQYLKRVIKVLLEANKLFSFVEKALAVPASLEIYFSIIELVDLIYIDLYPCWAKYSTIQM